MVTGDCSRSRPLGLSRVSSSPLDQISYTPGALRRLRGGLKPIGKLAVCGQRLRILRVQLIFRDHPLAARLRQLGHAAASDGLSTRLRSTGVANPVRGNSGNHAPALWSASNRFCLQPVPEARLLGHPAAALDHLHLTLNLILERGTNIAEAVHVLDFRFSAELLLSARPHAHVGVAAQRTLFHVAVAHTGIEQDLFEAGQVLIGLVWRADIGLAYNLDQGRAATVQVNIGLGRRLREIHRACSCPRPLPCAGE